jgi:hypothetical protein
LERRKSYLYRSFVPPLDYTCCCVHEIEGGEREMGWENLEEIYRRSGLASPAG